MDDGRPIRLMADVDRTRTCGMWMQMQIRTGGADERWGGAWVWWVQVQQQQLKPQATSQLSQKPVQLPCSTQCIVHGGGEASGAQQLQRYLLRSVGHRHTHTEDGGTWHVPTGGDKPPPMAMAGVSRLTATQRRSATATEALASPSPQVVAAGLPATSSTLHRRLRMRGRGQQPTAARQRPRHAKCGGVAGRGLRATATTTEAPTTSEHLGPLFRFE
jgi:hypothetical protein